MIVLPPGVFLKRSPDNDTEAQPNERPLRQIEMQRFAVSKYEITFANWSYCAANGGCDGYLPARDNLRDVGMHSSEEEEGLMAGIPVVNVSWDDAQEYVHWLSHVTGVQYRLLTDAEWEYAARGVTSARAEHSPPI